MLDSYTIGEKFPMLVKAEIDLLKECVNELLPDPVIVQIGAGVGASSLAMLEERDDLFIFSIDIEFPKTGIYKPGEKENLMLAGHWDGRLIQVLGSSQYVGQRWRFPIDLLFIDGDHRYEYVKQDIELFVPHVMEGGYILFHDYAEKLKKPKAGVKKAVDELLGHYEVVGQRKWLWAIMKPFTLHGTTE